MLRAALALTVPLLLGVAGGCGGSGSGGSGSGGSGQPAGSIKVTMSEFKFDPAAISAHSGKVTFFLVNSGSVAHDMVVMSPDGKRVGASDLVQGGNTDLFTIANLAAGSYQVICSQPGHADAGMKATLSVS